MNNTNELDKYDLLYPVTGSKGIEGTKEIIYNFEKYEIKIQLSDTNEFIGIIEIKVNQSFLNYQQKLKSAGFHDVDDMYSED